jgi:hypothetical protein
MVSSGARIDGGHTTPLLPPPPVQRPGRRARPPHVVSCESGVENHLQLCLPSLPVHCICFFLRPVGDDDFHMDDASTV